MRILVHKDLWLMTNAAYDAPQIHAYSGNLGHVAIIDHNPRSGAKKLMDPATKVRFGQRSTVERVNGDLKDNFGGSTISVKGAS